jgi:signal transduction histidine kinase
MTMNIASHTSNIEHSSGIHSREELLAAAAQASRLLLESSEVMACMSQVLQLFGEAAGVDRTTLALTEADAAGERWLLIKAQWNAPGVVVNEDRNANAQWPTRRADCFCSELTAGRSVYICGDGWSRDTSIASENAKSAIIVPFLVEGEYGGVVGFDTFHAERKFDAAVISALEIAASVVGAALQRERLLETMRLDREAAAEQRVAELARANAALRANLEHLAQQPKEFFDHVLLETARQAEADIATAIVLDYESDVWQVSCHVRNDQIVLAPFAAQMPGQDAVFVQQIAQLRQPLHFALFDSAALHDSALSSECSSESFAEVDNVVTLAEWPAFLDYHRSAGQQSLYLLPLVFGERTLGIVALGFRVHAPLRSELTELLVTLGQQATLAMAMKRLFYSSRQAAVLAERNRLGREIHDGLAQAFTGILMQLGAAEEQVEGSPLSSVLNRIRDIAREGLAEARRSVLALRPDEQPRPGGLELALRQLAERSTVADRITSRFQGGGATGLPPEHEHALLRIAQEAVINAVRHAQPSNIEIHLHCEAETLQLCIVDDGCGMQQLPKLYAEQGFGLNNMRERAEAIGGCWKIDSSPETGTRVSVKIPRSTSH